MMRIRRFAAGLTATAALMAGGCSSSTELAPNPPELQHSFDMGVRSWQKLGVALGDIQLQTVTEGAILCGEVNITNDWSPLTYCSGNELVVVADRAYATSMDLARRNGINPRAAASAAVNHELGHAVIKEAFMILPEKDEELLADCLAGVAVAATEPELGEQAGAFLGTLDGPIHGTSEERMSAFNNGFDNGVGGCSSTLAIMLHLPTSTPS